MKKIKLHVYLVSTKAVSKSWILYYFVYYQSKPDMNEWKKFSNFLWTPVNETIAYLYRPGAIKKTHSVTGIYSSVGGQQRNQSIILQNLANFLTKSLTCVNNAAYRHLGYRNLKMMCVYLLGVNIYTGKKIKIIMVILNGVKCLFSWKVSSII